MATTKKTTATKKARTTKKAAQAIPAEQPDAEVTAPVEPAPVEPEKTIMIPIDPAFESKDQMWEWNINGKNILIRRGEWVTLSASLADAIMDKLWKRDHVSAFVADFKNQSKKLN